MSAIADRPEASLEPMMLYMGRRAREAAAALALASTETKNAALNAMAARIEADVGKILEANAQDVEAARAKGRDAAFIDRLALDGARVAAMAKGLRDIASLADPVGEVMARWRRPNGLEISRVRVPIGVIGIIYELRPNVTADAAGLCLKSGNAAILRSGSESFLSSLVIANSLSEAVVSSGLPEAAIQLVPTVDRSAVGFMLGGLGGAVDVIVPRGGKDLVGRVQAEARLPVFAHLEGVCHVYVHEAADLDMAKQIVLNAKMRRTGICGAAETLLVDRKAAPTHLAPLVEMLIEAGCEVRGDPDDAARRQPGQARERRGLAERISRRHHRREVGRRPRRGGRAHRALRLATYRRHRHRGSRRGGGVPRPRRQRHRAAQRIDSVRRRRRVRHGGGDRHRHRPLPRARAGRRGATHDL